MKKKQLIYILVSLLIWSIFLLFPVFVLPRPAQYFEENERSKILYLLISSFSIGYYYYNYYWGIPRYFVTKKYLRYSLSLIVVFLLTPFSIRAIWLLLQPYLPENKESLSELSTIPYMLSFLLMLISSFFVYYYRRSKDLEIAKTKAELHALKAQINPHFFFNTLNIIYGQALLKSEETPDSIAKIASMMRYALSESNQGKVSLAQELNYIQSYLDLQQHRLTPSTTVNYTVEGKTEGIEIPAFIFINFIENAFKYGVSTEKATTIAIHFHSTPQALTFSCCNDIVNDPPNHYKSTQIGLKNTENRLRLTYGKNYQLTIQHEKNNYQITLKIKQS